LKNSIAKVEAAQLDINPPEKQLHQVKGKKALGKVKFKTEKTKKKGDNERQNPKTKGGLKAKSKKGNEKKLSDGKNEEPTGPEPTWNITKDKLVKIRKFQGETYIDIREYYMDKLSWEVKPGQKGVSLNLEQYSNLKAILPQLDALFTCQEEGFVDLLA